jgi:diguanylate cyclase (GGDEF)-like protein
MPIPSPCDGQLPCRRVFALFLPRFAILGAVGLLLLHIVTGYDRESERSRVWITTAQRTQLRREVASRTFQGIFPDLRFLASQNELRRLMEADTPENRELLCRELRHFVQEKGIYVQARYLDETGLEICRVDLRDGQAVVIPRADLQLKATAPYFREAIQLDKGQSFVSMLDLNVEHGRIEEPYNPVVRFCSPVFDRDGTKRGIVVLNYMGKQLLDEIRKVAPTDHARVLLLDAQGYYLIGRHPEEEWGFMFPDRRNCRLQNEFPDVWRETRESKRGQSVHGGYLFTFALTHALPEGTVSSTTYRLDPPVREVQHLAADQYRFVVVSMIPESMVLAQASWLAKHELRVAGALLFVTAFATFGAAQAKVRRDVARETIARLATYDTLTGLPNRNLFLDRLAETRRMALRYQRPFALLFIDLNGFKAINDTLGHEMGDELLRQVAGRIRRVVRSSDTVARIGGDEFVILVRETAAAGDAEAVCRKVVDALSPPFELKGTEGSIGASIGVAMFDPECEEADDDLISRADSAMYEAKATGESTYRFSSAPPEEATG